MRLLLIEDDNLLGDGIKEGLEYSGFGVDWFTDGLLGLEALRSVAYEAVVLDLSLPHMDGLEILKRWREEGYTAPVIILTARGEIEQRVDGLNLGADDYMVKPFALTELIARITAVVRRSHGVASNVLEHGDVSFYPDTRKVMKNNEQIAMPPRETALVELILLNKDRVLSKASIEEKLCSWDSELSSNSVEVHVHHIRKKLGTSFIRTVYGTGYTLGESK